MSDAYEEARERARLRSFPVPTAPTEEELLGGQAIVAESLSPQLGTDTTELALGKFDMQRLGIISPELQMALAYFIWRGGGQKYVDSKGEVKVRRGVKFWRIMTGLVLNLSPSVKGLGRKQLIQMQTATTPGAPPMPSPEKPGWLGRNVTNREWAEE